MLWHIELKFCTWLCFNVLQRKFECCHFASIFEGVTSLFELRISEICSFPHFSRSCSDILSWNFAYDFVLMYYRSSSSVITLCQFLKELCLFLNLEYRKCAVFHFLYARLQTGRIMVWWCPSGSPSVRLSVRPVSIRPFSALFSCMLWHIELKFCTWLCFDVLQIKFDCRHFASIFEGVMPLCELRIKVMCSFPHFSPTCFDILSSNFAYDFVSPYYRSRSSAVNLR